MLLAWSCEQADHSGRISLAMASLAAVNFHQQVGYKTVGQVATTHRTFSNMIREPKRVAVEG